MCVHAIPVLNTKIRLFVRLFVCLLAWLAGLAGWLVRLRVCPCLLVCLLVCVGGTVLHRGGRPLYWPSPRPTASRTSAVSLEQLPERTGELCLRLAHVVPIGAQLQGEPSLRPAGLPPQVRDAPSFPHKQSTQTTCTLKQKSYLEHTHI